MIKVKRGDEEIEIEESEVLDTDVPVTSQENKKGVTFDEAQQKHINQLIAAEKRKMQIKLEAVQNEFTTFKSSIEEKEQAEETKLKEKVDEMKKDAPQSIMKLLEKLTIAEQYEWLSDSENKVEKIDLPNNPKEKGDGKKNLGQVKVKF